MLCFCVGRHNKFPLPDLHLLHKQTINSAIYTSPDGHSSIKAALSFLGGRRTISESADGGTGSNLV